MCRSEPSSIVFDWPESLFWDYIASCEADELTPILLEYLPEDGTIIEGGCGTGRYVEYLSRRGYNIVGIEYNRDVIALIKRKLPHLDVRFGDISDLPYPDGHFSGYISLGVVEHFPAGPREPLREMYRILAPRGRAIITVPCMNYVRQFQANWVIRMVRHLMLPRNNNVVRNLLGKPPRRYHSRGEFPYQTWPEFGEFFEYRFTKMEFEQILRAVGFTIKKSVPIYSKEGMKYDLGPWFAKRRHMEIRLTLLGRLIHALIGHRAFWTNHQILAIVTKT